MPINEVKSVQMQLERSALSLGHRLETITSVLEELRYITTLLFKITSYNSDDIQAWLDQEEFDSDDLGYFKSNKNEKLFHDGKLPDNEINYHWPSSKTNCEKLRNRFYALRNIGPRLKQLKYRLGNVTIIYYQDIVQNACVAYPYFDMSKAIPADFEWDKYHAFESIRPETNPDRIVQWSPPNIDYAGEGLITIASIPVYEGDDCIGLWSVDVPFEAIHDQCVLDTYALGQTNFISDFDGNIITHPSVRAEIDKEKGSFYQVNLKSFGGGFEKLNLKEMVSAQTGVLDMEASSGVTAILMYRVIPRINWIMFATLPKDSIFEIARDKVTEAFRHMGKARAPEAIDLEVGGGLEELVDGFNEMVKIVAYNQNEREKAQLAALKAQKDLTRKLEAEVQERTRHLQQANVELERLSHLDGLTNVHNRRYFDEHLDRSWREQVRKKLPISLIMIDIDHFKPFNDAYGHQKGDECLIRVAQSFALQLKRPSDILARYGGEEFCVVLRDGCDAAMTIAERLRKGVEELAIPHCQSKKGLVSVSIGVNSVSPSTEDTMADFCQNADRALYSSKTAGRDCVTLYA
ncbi:MAG: sensor domain-containing diguanylate cyclase [Magnetovibrionaceae bacterium]